MTQTAPWLASKESAARQLSIVTHANVLRLISVPSGITNNSVKVCDRFLPIFSICMVPTDGDTALTVLINNQSVIPLGCEPE